MNAHRKNSCRGAAAKCKERRSRASFARGRRKQQTAVVAGGRKPAQPSIPEGILGFPPPDALLQGTLKTKVKLLKPNSVVTESRVKNPCSQQKIPQYYRQPSAYTASTFAAPRQRVSVSLATSRPLSRPFIGPFVRPSNLGNESAAPPGVLLLFCKTHRNSIAVLPSPDSSRKLDQGSCLSGTGRLLETPP